MFGRWGCGLHVGMYVIWPLLMKQACHLSMEYGMLFKFILSKILAHNYAWVYMLVFVPQGPKYPFIMDIFIEFRELGIYHCLEFCSTVHWCVCVPSSLVFLFIQLMVMSRAWSSTTTTTTTKYYCLEYCLSLWVIMVVRRGCAVVDWWHLMYTYQSMLVCQ